MEGWWEASERPEAPGTGWQPEGNRVRACWDSERTRGSRVGFEGSREMGALQGEGEARGPGLMAPGTSRVLLGP